MSTQIRTHRNILGAPRYRAGDTAGCGLHGGARTGIRQFQRLLRFLHEVILHDSMFSENAAGESSVAAARGPVSGAEAFAAGMASRGRPARRLPVLPCARDRPPMPEPNVLIEAVVVLAAAIAS